MKSRLHQEIRSIICVGLPFILMQVLDMAQTLVDTIMAGRFDTLTLAAVALAGQIFGIIFVLMLGFGIALAACISHANGRADAMAIRAYFQQGTWLSVVLALLTFILTNLAAFLPQLIGTTQDIAQAAKAYLHTLSFGAALLIFAMIPRKFLEGISDLKSNLLMLIAIIPINFLGNYIALYHTNSGVIGMALSTNFTYLVYVLGMFYTLRRHRLWHEYGLLDNFARPDFSILKQIISIGAPIGLTIVIEVTTFSLVGLIISRTDKITTAAHQIANNFSGLLFMIPLGLSTALTVLCANAYGNGDKRALIYRSKIGIGLAVGISFIGASVMFFANQHIGKLYSHDAQVLKITATIFLFAAAFQLVDAIQITTAGVLRGLHDTKAPMLYALTSYWGVGLGSGFMFGSVMGYGVYGYWAGLVLALSSQALLTSLRLYKKLKSLQFS